MDTEAVGIGGGVIALIFLVWVFYKCGMMVWRRYTMSRLRSERSAGEIQATFAEIRNDLMRAVWRREIDARSETFRFVYVMTTMAMRHTDRRLELSLWYLESLEDEYESREEKLEIEREEWSEEMERIAARTVRAMNELFFRSYIGGRLIAKLLQLSGEDVTIRGFKRLQNQSPFEVGGERTKKAADVQDSLQTLVRQGNRTA